MISIALTAVGKRAATNGKLRDAMREGFAEYFGEGLFEPWREHARGLLGDRGGLAIQADLPATARATALTFAIADGHPWAPLAQHWVRLALATNRAPIERALADLGCVFDPRAWPDVVAIHDDRDERFFVWKGKVGHAVGKTVRWLLGKDGDVELGSPALVARVGKAAKEALDSAQRERCGCPWCGMYDWADTGLFRRYSAKPKCHVQLIGLARETTRLVALRSGAIVGAGGGIGAFYTADAASRTWRTIPTLSPDDREIRALHAIGETELVAIAGASDRDPPWSSTSRDGGATWSAPRANGLPRTKKRGRVWTSRAAPMRVVFLGDGVLWVSSDGGCTFASLGEPHVDGKPFAIVRAAYALGERRIVLYGRREHREGDDATAPSDDVEVVASDDGGATFALVPDLAIPDGGSAFVSETGELVIAAGKQLLRSSDEGRTFDAVRNPNDATYLALGGRWFARGRRGDVAYSDDRGSTWRTIATSDEQFGLLWLDGADPTSVYADLGDVLARITVDTR